MYIIDEKIVIDSFLFFFLDTGLTQLAFFFLTEKQVFLENFGDWRFILHFILADILGDDTLWGDEIFILMTYFSLGVDTSVLGISFEGG